MSRLSRIARMLLLLSLLAATAHAAAPAPTGAEIAFEQQVNRLALELRCLVCQNQTIADSQAPLAVDLRNQIRDKLHQGDSERAILDYMVARYGDFVLYRPPVKPVTWLLWAGPFVMLVGGAAAMLVYLRWRRRATADQPVGATGSESENTP